MVRFGGDKSRGMAPESESTDKAVISETETLKSDFSAAEETELNLRQIAESKEPLSGKIVSIQPWGDYTLVVTHSSADHLKIYDDRAEKVDFPQSQLNAKSFSLREAVPGSGYLQNDIDFIFSSSAGQFVSKIKNPLMRKMALQVMRREYPRGSVDLSYHSTSYENFPVGAKKPQVLANGKYILFMGHEYDNLVCYITETKQGVTQAPKDWQRIDSFTDIPEDLAPYIESAVERNEELHPLNSDYSAYVTDVGINILPSGDLKTAPVFKDNLRGVGDNISTDPNNQNVIYYCASGHPAYISKLDMSGDPTTWQTRQAFLPMDYPSVKNLQMDPTGNFFLFYSENQLVLLAKDTLEEVKRVEGLSQVNFDAQGRIRAVNKGGRLVILEMETEKFVERLKKKRIAKLAEGINVEDIFSSAKQNKKRGASEDVIKDLEPVRLEWEKKLQPQLNAVINVEEAEQFKLGLNQLRKTLAAEGLDNVQIDFITNGISEEITKKEKTLAGGEVNRILTDLETKLQASPSLSSIAESKAVAEQLLPLELLMEEAAKERYRKAMASLNQQSAELFRREGDKILEDVNGLVKGVKSQLDQMSSKSEFDDWLEFRFPQLKSRLGGLAKDCPIEADVAYKGIIAARTELQNLAGEYKDKFEKEYAKVREAAAERTDALTENLRADASDLVSRIRTKGFKSREQAETYLGSSQAKQVLEQEIASLAGQNPDAAKELERSMKVNISNALSEIERGALVKVAETGQQMVIFGKAEFPRWEAKVKEEGQRRVDMSFRADSGAQASGLPAKKIMGDIELAITTAQGHKERVRLYENWDSEHEWRLGLLSYKGEEIPPSYVNGEEFKVIRKQFSEWSSGRLKDNYEAKKRSLFDLYKQRQKSGERDGKTDAAWQEQYKALLNEYAKFCSENHIALFRRADQVKGEKEISHNGKGFVPTWQSHWVVDADTESYLEEMAKGFKMQSDLHEGVLNLKGHAGTGKDVLIKMFCNRTNRPYFSTDCTKWTTEYELSEDVTLEAKDGGTQTIKVPSAVLNGIQTPGAVVYFNEVNGMPEQAQIFLHALWDEKRSLTLKTSSGKVVKADPTVLMASSMNPNYPGTFSPQFATRSRMVSVGINYPPLEGRPKAGDTNPNAPYNASEPLRIAREVKSLADLTYEPNLERNEFIQLWDHYVNGIKNGAPKPTKVQEFDINTILALVEFGDKLRSNFILNFEKTRDSRNALPVKQPLTSRELRRCAYALSQIPDSEKANADSDNTARALLERFFLSNIDSAEDGDKIKQAMRTWRSQKRVAG